jgi:hypothetical protein
VLAKEVDSMGSKDIKREVKKLKKNPNAANKAKPAIAPPVPTIREEKKKKI